MKPKPFDSFANSALAALLRPTTLLLPTMLVFSTTAFADQGPPTHTTVERLLTNTHPEDLYWMQRGNPLGLEWDRQELERQEREREEARQNIHNGVISDVFINMVDIANSTPAPNTTPRRVQPGQKPSRKVPTTAELLMMTDNEIGPPAAPDIAINVLRERIQRLPERVQLYLDPLSPSAQRIRDTVRDTVFGPLQGAIGPQLTEEQIRELVGLQVVTQEAEAAALRRQTEYYNLYQQMYNEMLRNYGNERNPHAQQRTETLRRIGEARQAGRPPSPDDLQSLQQADNALREINNRYRQDWEATLSPESRQQLEAARQARDTALNTFDKNLQASQAKVARRSEQYEKAQQEYKRASEAEDQAIKLHVAAQQKHAKLQQKAADLFAQTSKEFYDKYTAEMKPLDERLKQLESQYQAAMKNPNNPAAWEAIGRQMAAVQERQRQVQQKYFDKNNQPRYELAPTYTAAKEAASAAQQASDEEKTARETFLTASGTSHAARQRVSSALTALYAAQGISYSDGSNAPVPRPQTR